MTTTSNSQAGSTSVMAQQINAWSTAVATSGALAYSPNKFYCRSTDAKGHGQKIQGNLPPDIYAQISALVFSPDFPDYTMPMDVVRDLIVHGLHMRQAMIGDPRLREAIEESLHRLAFEEFSLRMAEDVERWESIEERLRDSLNALQGARAYGQMWVYLIHAEEMAESIPEPYRSGIYVIVEEWKNRVPADFRD